jgi:outer membrane protein assembly factor BamB
MPATTKPRILIPLLPLLLVVCGIVTSAGLAGEDAAGVEQDTAVADSGAPIWPMFGHDAQHTHRSLYISPENNAVKWLYSKAAIVGPSPAIGADGTVYAGSHDNNLYALNADGTLKWSYTTMEDVFFSPAIGADGTVYVGNVDLKLYALNPDGTLKWSHTTWDEVNSSSEIGIDG